LAFNPVAAEFYFLDALIRNIENVVLCLDFQKMSINVQNQAKALHLLLSFAVNQQSPFPNQIVPFHAKNLTKTSIEVVFICISAIFALAQEKRTRVYI
jgi:hypothetical protein